MPFKKGAFRSWVFVLNNYTEQEVEQVKAWAPDCSVLYVAKEVGELKGTPHLQGEVTFKEPKRLASLKKLGGGDRMKWIKKYCKDFLYPKKVTSDLIVKIDNRNQGGRTDLLECKESIDQGATKFQVWQAHFPIMVKYRRIEDYMTLFKSSTAGKPKYTKFKRPMIDNFERSIVLCGPTDIGKTQYAKAHFKNALVVRHIDGLKGFSEDLNDGIIFDDMDFNHWPRTSQIHLLDMEEDSQINVKHGMVTIPAFTKRIFTCNYFPFTAEDPAIERRIKLIILPDEKLY